MSQLRDAVEYYERTTMNGRPLKWMVVLAAARALLDASETDCPDCDGRGHNWSDDPAEFLISLGDPDYPHPPCKACGGLGKMALVPVGKL